MPGFWIVAFAFLITRAAIAQAIAFFRQAFDSASGGAAR